MTTTEQTYTPIERLVELWREGMSMGQIASEIGISRQRVSQRLIDAGYSPALRRAERLAENAATARAFRAQRAESIARRVEARDAACARFRALADELGVSVTTLGQYARATSGTYAKKRKGTGNRYGRGKLPARDTPEGQAVGDRILEACAPWSPMHLVPLATRRP